MAAAAPPSSASARAGEHNLPVPLTSLVGRVHEEQAITATLRRNRLVTLSGPGGVGKTRLALELAHRQVGRRPDGVWLVDLTAGPERPDVASETARMLEVRTPASGSIADALRRYLRERELLIVLDNCEHVVNACAELAASVLRSCPGVRIMATSREPLAVDGEMVWTLEPLAAEDAHRLFAERARQRRPEFLPDARADATIAELCERLDRLPLAIELAAARVGVMSPAEILSGVEGGLGELAARGRSRPARHWSVRATVDWSYRLLDEAEQQAFRNLAVFVGGFDADAAAAVGGVSSELLARLVDKSLITVLETPRGRTRYRLLEAVREYAHELLVDAGELDRARERHLRHFATLADAREHGWPSPRALALIDEHGADYENIRAALGWGADTAPCAARRFLAGTKDLFLMLGPADGRALAQMLLERCGVRDRERAEIQMMSGFLAFLVADVELAREILAEAQQLSAELRDRELEGWGRFLLGLVHALGGAIQPARVHLERTRSLHESLGGRTAWPRATAVLGLTFLMEGEPARARELAEEALAVDVREQDEWGQGHCHTYLGIIGDSTAARPETITSHYRQAVERLRPFRGGPLLTAALVGQAGVIAPVDPARALRVVAAADALRERAGARYAPFFRARVERVEATARAALDADAERIWADGRRMGIDEAIALAFGRGKERPATLGGLSVREQEVAAMVAKGLSNKEIAGRLHLSVRTVESHVRHALAKLRLVNRTQLAGWARERIQ